ncbi:MAG: hypothetical protein ACUVUC_06045 [Thermoguttaceae bacterium]
MKRTSLLAIAGLVLVATALGHVASAGERTLLGRIAYRRAQTVPWHGWYYESAWGMPVALVVPPTAETQTHWGWGVGGYRVTPIYHQFERNYPGPGYYDPARFLPTPAWPSDTDQFGVYYVRGPW